VGNKERGKKNRELHRNEREKKKKGVIRKERGEKGLSSAYKRIWNSVPSKSGCRKFFMVHRINRGLRVCLIC
jgi:hypothetical protein